MCRPSAEGGRRCPSHSDPAKIARRNERRRYVSHADRQWDKTNEPGNMTLKEMCKYAGVKHNPEGINFIEGGNLPVTYPDEFKEVPFEQQQDRDKFLRSAWSHFRDAAVYSDRAVATNSISELVVGSYPLDARIAPARKEKKMREDAKDYAEALLSNEDGLEMSSSDAVFAIEQMMQSGSKYKGRRDDVLRAYATLNAHGHDRPDLKTASDFEGFKQSHAHSMDSERSVKWFDAVHNAGSSAKRMLWDAMSADHQGKTLNPEALVKNKGFFQRPGSQVERFKNMIGVAEAVGTTVDYDNEKFRSAWKNVERYVLEGKVPSATIVKAAQKNPKLLTDEKTIKDTLEAVEGLRDDKGQLPLELVAGLLGAD